MSTEIERRLESLLSEYDKLVSYDISTRIVYKPLYDYFMILIKEIGIKYIGFAPTMFTSQLKGRWDIIKTFLEEMDGDTKNWNEQLNILHELRKKVEHKDDYIPSKKQLKKIRYVVPEFKMWVTATGVKYYKKSINFTFVQSFNHSNQKYIKKSEMLINEYGEEVPYLDNPHKIEMDSGGYSQIVPLINQIEERFEKISGPKDIKKTDIDYLLKLVQITSFLKGREDILLMNNLCPKCGDEIKYIEHYFGMSESDPEPDGVYWKFGCSNCDYYVADDTEYF